MEACFTQQDSSRGERAPRSRACRHYSALPGDRMIIALIHAREIETGHVEREAPPVSRASETSSSPSWAACDSRGGWGR